MSRERLEEINGATLGDGDHSLTLLAEDAAGNGSQVSVSFTLDTTAPTAIIASSLDTTSTVIEVGYSEAVSGLAVGNYTLTSGEEVIPVESVEEINSSLRQLNLGTRLNAGNYQLSITGVSDLAGNVINDTVVLDFTVIGASVEISPTSGSEMVSLTRETVVRFGKKVDRTTVNENTFALIANGESVAGRVVVSSTGEFATFFSDPALPASTSVRVTVLGDEIMGLDGVALDADGDGTPGGTLTADFSTLPLTQIEGTNVISYVYDSVNLDELGNNIPVVGATIRLDALPEVVAVTDSEGFFRLENVPAPLFAVHIDGGTATNAPTGTSYATVGKIFESVPGQEVQLNHHGEIFDIFLPTMAEGDIQELSATEDTEVGFGTAGVAQLQAMFPEVETSTWELLEVTFPAGSAQDEAGNVATTAVIVPVNPERLPAPLPPHLNPKLVVSIQAPGATNFDVPAPVVFPNLEGLAPGAKCLLFSFNHDSGEWEVVGTGTVSEDGLTIVSDPGTGILAPGWHFVNEGNENDPDPCEEHKRVAPMALTRGLQNYFFNGDNQMIPLSFTNAAPAECSTPLVVELTYDAGVAGEFLTGFPDKPYKLSGGDTEDLTISTKNLLPDIRNIEKDRLYGIKLGVKGYEEGNPSNELFNEEFHIYRFLDAADSDHGDGVVELADTANDGGGGVVRSRPIEYIVANGAMPKLEVEDGTHFSFDSSTKELKFDPTETEQDLTTSVKILSPDSEEIGSLTLKGDGEKLKIFIDRNAFLKSLEDLANGTLGGASDSEKGLINSSSERNNVVNGVISRIEDTLLKDFAPGWEFVDSPTNAVKVDVFDTTTARVPVSITSGPIGASFLVRGSRLSNYLDFDNQILNRIYHASRLENSENLSKAARNFLLSEALNERNAGEVIDIYLNSMLKQANFSSRQEIIDLVAFIIVHELAHTVGLVHTRVFVDTVIGPGVVKIDINGADDDILASGFDPNIANKRFKITKEALAIALGTKWNSEEAEKAVEYFNEYAKKSLMFGRNFFEPSPSETELEAQASPQANFDRDNPFRPGIVPIEELELEQPLSLLELYVSKEKTELGIEYTSVPYTQDWGQVPVDGLGGERLVKNWKLEYLDIADKQATLNDIRIESSTNAFQVTSTLTPGMILKAGEEFEITVTFDPITRHEHRAELIIEYEDGYGRQRFTGVELEGFGFTNDGDIELEVPNNNFGGDVLNGEPITKENFGTIKNIGLAPLTITDIVVTKGASQFGVTGLPEDFGPENPIIIAPNDTYTFHGTFDAKEIALQRGEIQIFSNDPETPIIRQPIVGTGFVTRINRYGSVEQDAALDYGNDFVMIAIGNSRDPLFTFRTQSDSAGDWKVILPAETYYRNEIYDPVSALLHKTASTSGPSGVRSKIYINNGFGPSSAPDTDGDGLPDDIERIIGTDKSNPDTDKDGIDDFNEIELGLDPFGGQQVITGIIASLPLQGEAKAVVVEGDPQAPQNQTAYVATGSHGLAIIDASKFSNPIIQGQLSLPGDATDVAVDTKLKIAAVATNSGGLQIVDISDPMVPTLRRTINFNANQVEIFDGIVYATAGNSLRAYDLLTGAELDNTTLPGSGTVTGLAREGTKLYSYTSGSDIFSIIDITDPTDSIVLRQLNVRIASSAVRVFAANGVAYLAGSGMHTIDISDTNYLTLVSDAYSFFPARNIAGNGSGLAAIAVEDRGLSIYDITNPKNTDTFLTRFDTPGFARDIAIASGIAFIADNTGGLQVINYRPFDNKGEAPTITISSSVDVDPDTEGVQVTEGGDIPIIAAVTDDVQVGHVELLVNGEVVSNDVSFPFELAAIALSNDPDAAIVEVQARATDTGGNTALSNKLTFDLVPDTFGPVIESITPADGGNAPFNSRRVTVRFNEALAETTVTAENFQLLNGSGEAITPENIQLRSGDRTVQLTYETLLPGEYSIVIKSAQVTDRAGNLLGSEDMVTSFTVNQLVEFNLSDLNGSNGFVLNGIDSSDYSGRSVSGAGDINGDGIDDLIIGARGAEPNGIYNAGETYVVFGSDEEFDPSLNLSDLNGSNGFVLNGIDSYDQSGFSVSGAGDINGDGISDLIIGAPSADRNGKRNVGETYVVFGSDEGFDASFNLSDLNGSNGFALNGIDSYDSSGFSVSGAGDINGDGIDDLIIGARGAEPNGIYNAGETYVVFGSDEEFDPSLNLSDLNGSNGFVLNGIDSYDQSGFSVSGAGDINGDGIHDLIIGAHCADPNGNHYAGETYVVFGSDEGFDPSFNLSNLNGSNGFVINGIDSYDYSGSSVSGAGDINGDGIDDLIIGAWSAEPNGIYNAGETYVVFGSDEEFAANLDLSDLDGSNGIVLNGIDRGDHSGSSVSGAGDINGDGIDDLIIGAHGADPNGNHGAGETYVVFGSNQGFAATLDLSDLDGSNGFVLNGIDSGDNSGRSVSGAGDIDSLDFSGSSVSGAGDINGDGISDLIIGARGADPNGNSGAGETYVVFGSRAFG